MRKIKFRGLRHFDNGKAEWVYGFYVERWNNKRCIAQYAPKERPDAKDCYEDHWDIFVDVYEDSIGQYTGFKDKNGKEIYEGDIVLVKGSVKAECTWSNGFHLYGKTYDNERGYYDYCFTQDLEVIGNIHDKKGEE